MLDSVGPNLEFGGIHNRQAELNCNWDARCIIQNPKHRGRKELWEMHICL
jgi:hypothetical protein